MAAEHLFLLLIPSHYELCIWSCTNIQWRRVLPTSTSERGELIYFRLWSGSSGTAGTQTHIYRVCLSLHTHFPLKKAQDRTAWWAVFQGANERKAHYLNSILCMYSITPHMSGLVSSPVRLVNIMTNYISEFQYQHQP